MRIGTVLVGMCAAMWIGVNASAEERTFHYKKLNDSKVYHFITEDAKVLLAITSISSTKVTEASPGPPLGMIVSVKNGIKTEFSFHGGSFIAKQDNGRWLLIEDERIKQLAGFLRTHDGIIEQKIFNGGVFMKAAK